MFDLNGLNAIYNEALRRDEPTIVFELFDGIGRFVFMMFFSDDDASKDQLFILLGRTDVLIALKMYGSHRKGHFQVYLSENDELAIKQELGIEGGRHPFNLNTLLARLNAAIPQMLPLADSIAAIQRNRNPINNKLRSVVDDAARIYLIGPKRLTRGRPREKTLRKLYLYLDAEPHVITQFIEALKHANCTVAWSPSPLQEPRDLLAMINQIA